MATPIYDVCIIGAGLSGLIAADRAAKAGKSVCVIDKGKNVGGRFATRRIGKGQADHGAQFFTVREQAFQEIVDEWEKLDQAYVWCNGWAARGSLDGKPPPVPENGHPRYATHGFANLAKHMVEDLKGRGVHVFKQTRAFELHRHQGSELTSQDSSSKEIYWQVKCRPEFQLPDGTEEMAPPVVGASRLVLAFPPPQALLLLRTSNIPLPPQEEEELRKVKFLPCLCLLYVPSSSEPSVPDPGACQTREDEVTLYIADNQAKGISPNEKVITVQCQTEYSRVHFDDPDDSIIQEVGDALRRNGLPAPPEYRGPSPNAPDLASTGLNSETGSAEPNSAVRNSGTDSLSNDSDGNKEAENAGVDAENAGVEPAPEEPAREDPVLESGPIKTQIKRWRYSLASQVHPQRFCGIESLGLYFCGDSFGSPRVEGAALSGLALGEHLAAN